MRENPTLTTTEPRFAVPTLLHNTTVATGDGWSAIVMATCMYIYVSPEGDPLPDAIATVLSAARQPFSTVEYSHEDDSGWDVYYVQLIENTAQESARESLTA